ncbi:MAG: hypothetical protein GC192_05305 [Bacteroidetes bacterium]|nr:hypothetical protein [Bacteroidota bacterium]
MKKLFFLLLFALPMAIGFAMPPVATLDCTCDAPTNVHKTSYTTTSATFSWTAVSGATGYKVKYVRQSDAYASPEWTTTSTSYTFTSLTPGAYKFYFATDCGEEVSGFIIIDDINGT